MARRTAGDVGRRAAPVWAALADLYETENRAADAETARRNELASHEDASTRSIEPLKALADLRINAGDPHEARTFLERAADLAKRYREPDDPTRAEIEAALAGRH